ncbi:MAG: hypothetical protein U0547_03310 [Dehalococcoidia bacterium]
MPEASNQPTQLAHIVNVPTGPSSSTSALHQEQVSAASTRGTFVLRERIVNNAIACLLQWY